MPPATINIAVTSTDAGVTQDRLEPAPSRNPQLAIEDVTVRFGVVALERGQLRRGAGRNLWTDRPERRQQDHDPARRVFGSMLALGSDLAAATSAIAGMMVADVIYLDPNMKLWVRGRPTRRDRPAGRRHVGGLIVGVAENLLGTT
jgi:hypothetical protein